MSRPIAPFGFLSPPTPPRTTTSPQQAPSGTRGADNRVRNAALLIALCTAAGSVLGRWAARRWSGGNEGEESFFLSGGVGLGVGVGVWFAGSYYAMPSDDVQVTNPNPTPIVLENQRQEELASVAQWRRMASGREPGIVRDATR